MSTLKQRDFFEYHGIRKSGAAIRDAVESPNDFWTKETASLNNWVSKQVLKSKN